MSRYLKRFSQFVENFIKDFLTSTEIHGISHVLDKSLQPLERILWTLLIIFTSFGAGYVCMVQYNHYLISQMVVSLVRDYRNWDNTLPAATFCYNDTFDPVKANDYIKRTWNIDKNNESYNEAVKFLRILLKTTVNNYKELSKYADNDKFKNIDLKEAILNSTINPDVETTVFKGSAEVFTDRIMTEKGICWIANSAISSILSVEKNTSSEIERRPLSCPYGALQCFIKVNTFESHLDVALHSPYDFTDSSTLGLPSKSELSLKIKVTETVASEKLRGLEVEKRKCIFKDEGLGNFPIYTKSFCLFRCRALLALKKCNCVPFFYSFMDGPECSLLGFKCLSLSKWPSLGFKTCECPSTCTDQDYYFQSTEQHEWIYDPSVGWQPKAHVRWDLIIPKVRRKRDVLFTFDDLLGIIILYLLLVFKNIAKFLVSLGGAVGLFLGVSFTSAYGVLFVIISYFIIQPTLHHF